MNRTQMRRSIGIFSLITLLAVLSACVDRAHNSVDGPQNGEPASAQHAVLGEAFSLCYAEQVSISSERLSLTFEQVLEDSRCPKGVQCIWAGRVRILLGIEQDGAAPAKLELDTDPRYESGHAAAYQGYTVALSGVSAYPQDLASYCATLKVVQGSGS